MVDEKSVVHKWQETVRDSKGQETEARVSPGQRQNKKEGTNKTFRCPYSFFCSNFGLRFPLRRSESSSDFETALISPIATSTNVARNLKLGFHADWCIVCVGTWLLEVSQIWKTVLWIDWAPPFPPRVLAHLFFSSGLGIPIPLIRVNIIYLIQAQARSHRKNWVKAKSQTRRDLSQSWNLEQVCFC